MKKIIVCIMLFLLAMANVYADKTTNLFVIERSKNANVVNYDAVLTDEGKINENKPIDAYWLLYAYKNGEREELSAFDKKAYGFKVKYNEEKKYFDFVLKAVKEKPMILNLYIPDCFRIYRNIYFLSRFILPGPSVNFICHFPDFVNQFIYKIDFPAAPLVE